MLASAVEFLFLDSSSSSSGACVLAGGCRSQGAVVVGLRASERLGGAKAAPELSSTAV